MTRIGPFIQAVRLSPDFTLLWLGRTVSALGDAVRNIALVWLVKELTGSAVAMGLVMACSALPYLIFGLVAGAIVDRGDRRRLLIWCDLVSAVVVLAIPALAGYGLIRFWHLCGLAFTLSTISAFWNPAFMAAVPSVVPGKDLMRANSLMSVTGQLAGILGPALAGAMIAAVGVGTALALDAVSFFLGALAISCTRFPGRAAQRPADGAEGPPSGAARPGGGILVDIGAGLGYVWRSRPLLVVVVAALTLNLFVAPRMVLMAVHVERVWQAGPEVYGLMASIFSVGTLTGAALTGDLGRRVEPGSLVLVALLMNALAGSGLAIASGAASGGVALAVIGLTMVTVNITITAWLQTTVPASLRGRVFSAVNVGATATVPAAQALAGVAADSWGTSAFFLLSAAVTAAGGLALKPALSLGRPAAGADQVEA